LYHFTGANWGEKFVGITKYSWVKAYMALDDNHHAIDCFKELGEGLIQNQLANGELPTQFKDLEKFVCQVTAKRDLPPFLNFDGSSFDSGTWKVRCANFIAMRDKSCTTSCPDLPLIKENGWSEN